MPPVSAVYEQPGGVQNLGLSAGLSKPDRHRRTLSTTAQPSTSVPPSPFPASSSSRSISPAPSNTTGHWSPHSNSVSNAPYSSPSITSCETTPTHFDQQHMASQSTTDPMPSLYSSTTNGPDSSFVANDTGHISSLTSYETDCSKCVIVYKFKSPRRSPPVSISAYAVPEYLFKSIFAGCPENERAYAQAMKAKREKTTHKYNTISHKSSDTSTKLPPHVSLKYSTLSVFPEPTTTTPAVTITSSEATNESQFQSNEDKASEVKQPVSQPPPIDRHLQKSQHKQQSQQPLLHTQLPLQNNKTDNSSTTTTTTTTNSNSNINTVVSNSPSPASPTSALSPSPALNPLKKSWADMVRKASPTTISSNAPSAATSTTIDERSPLATSVSSADGSRSQSGAVTPVTIDLPAQQKSSISNIKPVSLSDALIGVEMHTTIPQIRPRGLINLGSMCFENVILQSLLYCPPFYELLKRLRQGTVKKFESKAKLVDSLIDFLEEFEYSPAPKDNDSVYGWSTPGESFVPSGVYASHEDNQRFDGLRQGQQDAQEFLGFFLETLNDEILYLCGESNNPNDNNGRDQQKNNDGSLNGDADDVWTEIGSKGRPATTQVTAVGKESAVTRIFGGKWRSVLKCPGHKDSATLEPFMTLQLDIQPLHIKSIADALEYHCAPENVTIGNKEAVKQFQLETLPPVLILHLKRFLYDTEQGSSEKNSKVIRYPSEMEINPSLFSPARRKSQPSRYVLAAVIYHHGRTLTGGHYTADIRLSDSAVSVSAKQKTWLTVDDTTLRLASWEDVEHAGLHGGSDRTPYLLLWIRRS